VFSDVSAAELTFVNNCPSSSVSVVIIGTVALIVNPVVPQRSPAAVTGIPMPVNPSRSPLAGRNPVPAPAGMPLPSTVMINAPTEWFIGYPGPTKNRVPNPSSVEIGAPAVVYPRNPDIAIRRVVTPAAITIQKIFIISQTVGQVPLRDSTSKLIVASKIPTKKIIEGNFRVGIDICFVYSNFNQIRAD